MRQAHFMLIISLDITVDGVELAKQAAYGVLETYAYDFFQVDANTRHNAILGAMAQWLVASQSIAVSVDADGSDSSSMRQCTKTLPMASFALAWSYSNVKVMRS